MKIDEIQQMFEEDSKIDKACLDVESLRSPELLSKYLKIFYDERSRYRQFVQERATLKRQKYEWFNGKMSREELEALGWEVFNLRILKTDMDIYMEADPDLLKIDNKLFLQEEKLKVLEAIMKSINARQWDIKNAISWAQFINGK